MKLKVKGRQNEITCRTFCKRVEYCSANGENRNESILYHEIYAITESWGLRAAVLTAQKVFIARIGELKRTMKTFLRIVNDQFGMWSIKFRMCFVINGLLNFARHFANDHTDCPRFVWWIQFSDSQVRY